MQLFFGTILDHVTLMDKANFFLQPLVPGQVSQGVEQGSLKVLATLRATHCKNTHSAVDILAQILDLLVGLVVLRERLLGVAGREVVLRARPPEARLLRGDPWVLLRWWVGQGEGMLRCIQASCMRWQSVGVCLRSQGLRAVKNGPFK